MKSQSPHRVLFVSEGYPPTSGGVATSAQRVARNLVRLGCEVMVVTFDGSRPLTSDDYAIEEEDDGVHLWRIGPFFLKQPSIDVERMSEKVRAILRRRAFDQMHTLAQSFKPTVVLSFYILNAGMLATYLAHAVSVPHVAGVRGNDIGRNIFSVDRLAAVRLVVDNATRIVCVNLHLRQRLLLAFPEAASRCNVIMNGLELPFDADAKNTHKYLETETGWPTKDPVAVFIGAPREKKGIAFLLRAVELARAHIPLRLLIVGPELGNAEERQCGMEWSRLVKSNVLHVTGHLDRATALRIAAEGDIVVMPSIEDGMANGLLEGMALGLAPVASDLFSDVVSANDAGWVVKRNSVSALAAALVEAGGSPEQRRTRAATAQKRIAEYHQPEGEAAAYVALFEELALQ
jgi:glycosyltransferase involved in cell wall biosynthesis